MDLADDRHIGPIPLPRIGSQGSCMVVAQRWAWTRSDVEHATQTKKPSIAEGSRLSFTGTAASVMDGRPLCLCSVVGTDYMFDAFADVNKVFRHRD